MLKNKLKIATLVAFIVAGMIVYKIVFDKKEVKKENEEARAVNRNGNDLN